MQLGSELVLLWVQSLRSIPTFAATCRNCSSGTHCATGVYRLSARKADRAVRVATLFSQIANLHALPDGKGLKGIKPSVEALAGEGVSMSNINLSGADLRNAQLSGAKLDGADLSGADLVGADLSLADLSHSDLTAASLYEATVTGANLYEANISDARLLGVKGLKQGQLNLACATDDQGPDLGIGHRFRWSGKICGYE